MSRLVDEAYSNIETGEVMRADLFVEVRVECQTEQVSGILRGAVRMCALLVLDVLQAESGLVGIAGGGPDHLGGVA